MSRRGTATALGVALVTLLTVFVATGPSAAQQDGPPRTEPATAVEAVRSTADGGVAGIDVAGDPAGRPAVEYRDPEPGTASDVEFSRPAGTSNRSSGDTSTNPPEGATDEDAERTRTVELDAAALTRALDAESVSITLFADVTAELTTTIAPSDGALDSTLYAAGEGNSDSAVVTVRGDYAVGQFWVDGTQYLLRSDSAVTATISELSPDGDPHRDEHHGDAHHGDDDFIVANSPPGEEQPDPRGDPGGTPGDRGPDGDETSGPTTRSGPTAVIDVMIAVDDDAFGYYEELADGVDGEATMLAEAAAMVNLTNASYVNTGVDQQVNLTNVYRTLSTPSTPEITDYLKALRAKTDGTFDEIHALRDTHQADLVSLISASFSGVGVFGIAYVPGNTRPSERSAFSVVEAAKAITNLTFPHELGHNQCAGHDDSPLCGYPDGRGFDDPDEPRPGGGTGRRTVMARSSLTGSQRYPVFSRNDHIWDGWAHGDAAHDNAFVLAAEVVEPGSVSGGVANHRPLADEYVAGADGSACIYTSLEEALLDVVDGGTIHLAPGTHVGEDAGANFNVYRDVTITTGEADCTPAREPGGPPAILQRHPASTSDAVLEVWSGHARLGHVVVENGGGSDGAVRVDDGGRVTLDGTTVRSSNNPSASLGGGALRIDDEARADITGATRLTGNSAANRGGAVYVAPDGADVDTVGGVLHVSGPGTGFRPALVEGNVATEGGGIWAGPGAQVVIAGLHVHGNEADRGGGIAVSGAVLSIAPGPGCQAETLAFEQYCSELRGNHATDSGGGLWSDGGTIDTVGTSFIDNTADNSGAALAAAGTADVRVRAAMLLGQTASTATGAIHLTGSSSLDATAVTSADAVGPWLAALDDTTATVVRVVATTTVHSPDGVTGSCNLRTVGAGGLPGSSQADPQFVTTARSSFVPKASSEAVDACAEFGAPHDAVGAPVRNGDGLESPTEYDIGGLEAPTGLGHSCAGTAATIVGSAGPDTISGTTGPDVIVTLGGSDVVEAGSGGDLVCAGNGNDVVAGGRGNDHLLGEGGADTLRGGRGADDLSGGTRSDLLVGQAGRDELRGGSGNDDGRGGPGDDLLIGESGADDLSGGPGDDELRGGLGDDLLRGDRGDDRLLGGPRDDELRGGPGDADVCNGQGGADTATACETALNL